MTLFPTTVLPTGEIDPNTVRPGWVALLIVLVLGAATFLLWRNMTKQMKRIDFDPTGGEPVPEDDAADDRASSAGPSTEDRSAQDRSADSGGVAGPKATTDTTDAEDPSHSKH